MKEESLRELVVWALCKTSIPKRSGNEAQTKGIERQILKWRCLGSSPWLLHESWKSSKGKSLTNWLERCFWTKSPVSKSSAKLRPPQKTPHGRCPSSDLVKNFEVRDLSWVQALSWKTMPLLYLAPNVWVSSSQLSWRHFLGHVDYDWCRSFFAETCMQVLLG